MNVIEKYRKRRAIRSYVTKLPQLLAKDYGSSKTYTPQQVRRTIERSGMNMIYSCYGVSMFSSREDFDQFTQKMVSHVTTTQCATKLGTVIFPETRSSPFQILSRRLLIMKRAQIMVILRTPVSTVMAATKSLCYRAPNQAFKPTGHKKPWPAA